MNQNMGSVANNQKTLDHSKESELYRINFQSNVPCTNWLAANRYQYESRPIRSYVKSTSYEKLNFDAVKNSGCSWSSFLILRFCPSSVTSVAEMSQRKWKESQCSVPVSVTSEFKTCCDLKSFKLQVAFLIEKLLD